jgi:hypothetical protein
MEVSCHPSSIIPFWLLPITLHPSSLTWYNSRHETESRISNRRCSGYKCSPSFGTALRLAACHSVRLNFVLQVPDLLQVRDFLLQGDR